MLKIKRIIIFSICILALCGCENKKCIKSHKEKSTCTRIMCLPTGKTVMCIPSYYPCENEICDEYLVEKCGDDNENI